MLLVASYSACVVTDISPCMSIGNDGRDIGRSGQLPVDHWEGREGVAIQIQSNHALV